MGFSSGPSTTQSNLSPAQQNYQSTAANFLAGQVGQPGPAYPGQHTAPLSPQQAQAIGTQGALGQAAAGPEATGFNTLGNIAGGSYLYDPNIAAMLGSEAAYAQDQFDQNLNSIRAPFQMAGQVGYSSPSDQYLANQAGQFQLGLSSNLAQQGEHAYQQALDRQQQAAVQSATLGGAAGQQGLAALTMPQQIQQEALNRQYQDWLRVQQNPWQAALGVPSLMGPQSQTSTQGGSIFDTLGGLAGLAGPFALLRMAKIL
jgi:hypothetical protein